MGERKRLNTIAAAKDGLSASWFFHQKQDFTERTLKNYYSIGGRWGVEGVKMKGVPLFRWPK